MVRESASGPVAKSGLRAQGAKRGVGELSLLSSVITYDGLSVAREWLGRAVGLGRAPRGAPDVHRTSAVT